MGVIEEPRPSRPRDDDTVPFGEALRWQRDIVAAARCPVAALVLEAVNDDVRAGGALVALLPATVRFGSFPGLRVMAAVHRLALDREAPRVAAHLPTLGGVAPTSPAQADRFRHDVVRALQEHPEVLAASLLHTPQTNETGRAALLRCALSREDPQRPVRLREIGSSAGLNLRADHLPGQPPLEAGPLPPVLDRLGCDLHPVDVAMPSGRALLSSYVWVDDVDRFRRLAAAMRVAERVPATVVQRDAVDFCRDLEPRAGDTTVLWHSAMWAYLPHETRSGVLAEVARAGRAAAPDAPLVHVSWEWQADSGTGVTFALVVRRWTGAAADGRPRLLATGTSHGGDVVLVDEGWLERDPLLT